MLELEGCDRDDSATTTPHFNQISVHLTELEPCLNIKGYFLKLVHEIFCCRKIKTCIDKMTWKCKFHGGRWKKVGRTLYWICAEISQIITILMWRHELHNIFNATDCKYISIFTFCFVLQKIKSCASICKVFLLNPTLCRKCEEGEKRVTLVDLFFTLFALISLIRTQQFIVGNVLPQPINTYQVRRTPNLSFKIVFK